MKEAFPTTPIYPALANHDFYPVNYQAFNVTQGDILLDVYKVWKEYFGEYIPEYAL